MLVNIKSPVEARRYELYKAPNKNMVYCKIYFTNLSDKAIEIVELIIKCFDSFGLPIKTSSSNEVMSQIHNLRAEPKSAFHTVQLIPLHDQPNTASIKLVIKKVTYADGELWIEDGEHYINVETDRLSGEALKTLQNIAGKDAVCYARQMDSYWQCICGRVNLNSDSQCLRCDRHKLNILKMLAGSEHALETKESLYNKAVARKAYLAVAKNVELAGDDKNSS